MSLKLFFHLRPQHILSPSISRILTYISVYLHCFLHHGIINQESLGGHIHKRSLLIHMLLYHNKSLSKGCKHSLAVLKEPLFDWPIHKQNTKTKGTYSIFIISLCLASNIYNVMFFFLKYKIFKIFDCLEGSINIKTYK